MISTQNYPKILILGQSFNTFSGGGITLSNLFKNWPKNKIAVASATLSSDNSICNIHYRIGYDEVKKIWPFSIFQEKLTSEVVHMNDNNQKLNTSDRKRNIATKTILKHKSKDVLNFFGVFLFINKIKFSKKFQIFFENFKPDVIYTQLASLELINFVIFIHKHCGTPVVVHIMDDWISVINKGGLFGNYWHHKTHRRFMDLLRMTSLVLVISEAMSKEYKLRYNVNCKVFHNIVDFEAIAKEQAVNNYSEDFRIAYFGRIGQANQQNLKDMIEVVNIISKSISNITFDIFTPDYNNTNCLALINELSNSNCSIKESVPYNSVIKKMTEYELLFLPLDFDKKSVLFAQYSLPTKAIDYLASCRPILLYAPKNNAITQYADKHGFAYTVTQRNKDDLINGIRKLYMNIDLRKKLIDNSKETFIKNHNPQNVRKDFLESINAVLKKGVYAE